MKRKRTPVVFPLKERIAALKRYKEEHGTTRVPRRFSGPGPAEYHLGRWVHTCRIDKARHSKEKLQLLDEAGFSWTARDDREMQHLSNEQKIKIIKKAVSRARKGEVGCILWPQKTSRYNTNSVRVKGKWHTCHHVAMQLYTKMALDGLVCYHRRDCNQKRCINPRHLALRTKDGMGVPISSNHEKDEKRLQILARVAATDFIAFSKNIRFQKRMLFTRWE